MHCCTLVYCTVATQVAPTRKNMMGLLRCIAAMTKMRKAFEIEPHPPERVLGPTWAGRGVASVPAVAPTGQSPLRRDNTAHLYHHRPPLLHPHPPNEMATTHPPIKRAAQESRGLYSQCQRSKSPIKRPRTTGQWPPRARTASTRHSRPRRPRTKWRPNNTAQKSLTRITQDRAKIPLGARRKQPASQSKAKGRQHHHSRPNTSIIPPMQQIGARKPMGPFARTTFGVWADIGTRGQTRREHINGLLNWLANKCISRANS